MLYNDPMNGNNPKFLEDTLKRLAPRLARKKYEDVITCAAAARKAIIYHDKLGLQEALYSYAKKALPKDRDLPLRFLHDIDYDIRHFFESSLEAPSSSGVPETLLTYASKSLTMFLISNLDIPTTQEHIVFLQNKSSRGDIFYAPLVAKLLHEKSFDALDRLCAQEKIDLNKEEDTFHFYYRLSSSHGLMNKTLSSLDPPKLPLYTSCLRSLTKDTLDYLLQSIPLKDIMATNNILDSVPSLWGNLVFNTELREEEWRQKHYTQSLLEQNYLKQGIKLPQHLKKHRLL